MARRDLIADVLFVFSLVGFFAVPHFLALRHALAGRDTPLVGAATSLSILTIVGAVAFSLLS